MLTASARLDAKPAVANEGRRHYLFKRRADKWRRKRIRDTKSGAPFRPYLCVTYKFPQRDKNPSVSKFENSSSLYDPPPTTPPPPPRPRAFWPFLYSPHARPLRSLRATMRQYFLYFCRITIVYIPKKDDDRPLVVGGGAAGAVIIETAWNLWPHKKFDSAHQKLFFCRPRHFLLPHRFDNWK